MFTEEFKEELEKLLEKYQTATSLPTPLILFLFENSIENHIKMEEIYADWQDNVNSEMRLIFNGEYDEREIGNNLLECDIS